MKRKTAHKQTNRCIPIFEDWVAKLNLQDWEVNVDYYRSKKQFKKHNGNATMKCWVKWEYLSFDVNVNLSNIRWMTDKELEYTIVHELCHAMVNEMLEPDPDGKHEERVVTMLARAFITV